MKLYHVPGTRSSRVIWLCEELGVPLDIEPISFSPEFRFSEEWLGKNPVGKVPVLEDGDLSMFESGAMVQYILDRYGDGRLQPEPGTADHALYLQWSWFAEATFARPLGEIVNHRREFNPELPDVVGEMKHRVGLCQQALDQAVTGRDFILGEFSAADIMIGYCLFLSERLRPADEYPELMRYWRGLSARPGARAAFSNLQAGPLGQ